MASSSSSSSTPHQNYQVFLSFRGEDTRKNFTDHLFHALTGAGIRTFRDDEELERGHCISQGLLKAIRESKISIVVFSKDYPASRWCLDELVEILECKKVNEQVVFPVFYHVDPSDVRKQTGSFADVFVRHDKCFDKGQVEKWRSALKAVATLSGFHLQDESEAEFIEKIVGEVSNKVIPTELHVAKYPVGLDHRVEVLTSLLGIGGDGVRILGIYGMGGAGKTTTAKCLYNSSCRLFDCCSFLENIRAQTEQFNGLVHLQEQLLSDTLKKSEIKVGNVARGINVLRERLGGKKTLLVLDDLDKRKQFESLAGKEGWFAPGSRIIITTRDQHILDQANVDERYEIRGLDEHQSLELFNSHAFEEPKKSEGFVELSKQIIHYAQGLPLALEILGSDLFKKERSFWVGLIKKLKENPPTGILETLRISFDSLEDTEKCIFLDIACCFKSMREEDALEVFEGCGFHPTTGICRLIDKCLLKIFRGVLTMHDLLRDMGREIVREEHSKEPEMRSRLWRRDDVCTVLGNVEKKKAIECIILDSPQMVLDSPQMVLSTEAFERMPNLRLIQIDNVTLEGNCEGLFKKVRWFCWRRSPLTSLPLGFQPERLVSLDMQESKMKILWMGVKLLDNLKLLNLNGCKSLTTTPNFIGTRNLMELSLKMCTSLSYVHPSIGRLHKLTKLDLAGCVNLKRLPSEICDLKLLEKLCLDGCSSIERLPEELGSMESLKVLLLGATAIVRLPDSIGNLDQLESLNLVLCCNLRTLPSSICHCNNLRSISLVNCINLVRLPHDIGNLDKLEVLHLDECIKLTCLPGSTYRLKLSGPPGVDSCSKLREFHGRLTAKLLGFELSKIHVLNLDDNNMNDRDMLYFCSPTILKELSSLERLSMSRNKFSVLPLGLGQLSNLKQLDLNGCKELRIVVVLPRNLRILCANDCASLEKLPDLGLLPKLEILKFNGCSSLRTVLELPPNLQGLEANGCTLLEKLPDLSSLENMESISLKNCCRLAEIQGLANLPKLRQVSMINCTSLGILTNISNIEQLKRLKARSSNDTSEDISVDLACFFNGMDKEYAIKILDACGFFGHIGINTLVRNSLVEISSDNKLLMVDDIFDEPREESLWSQPVVHLLDDVLPDYERTEVIGGLTLDKTWHGYINTRPSLPDRYQIGDPHRDIGRRTLHKSFSNEPENQIGDPHRDIGRRTLHKSFSNEPEKQTWVWRQDDIFDLLANNKGTDEIEGIAFELQKQNNFSTRPFARMPKLRLLKINNVNLHGSFEGLFEELRWLCWRYCRLESLPSELNLEKLVCLDMQGSNLKILWSGVKLLRNLKTMDLSFSSLLTVSPDFSGVQNLEELRLYGCTRLLNIDSSIGLLDKLITLDLGLCKNLKSLPSSIGSLRALEKLVVSQCSHLEGLPKELGDMKCLKELDASGSGIRELPDTIVKLELLEKLVVSRCSHLEGLPKELGDMKCLKELDASDSGIRELPATIVKLESLETLCLDSCSSLQRLPEQLGNLVCLQKLSVSGSAIRQLPDSIGRLLIMKSLYFDRCRSLVRLPTSICNLEGFPEEPRNMQLKGTYANGSTTGLPDNFCTVPSSILVYPPNVEYFSANYCASLSELPKISCLHHLKEIQVKDCYHLYEIQGFENLNSLRSINIINCKSLRKLSEISNLEYLEKIEVRNCNSLVEIQGLEHLKSVRSIKIKDCASLEKLSKISNLEHLEEIELENCVKLVEIQGMENLKSVRSITIKNCTFLGELPNLSNLKNLCTIELVNYKRKAGVQGLENIKSVQSINFEDCTLLEKLPSLSNLEQLRTLTLWNSRRLVEIQGLEDLRAIQIIRLYSCVSLEKLPNLSNLEHLKVLYLEHCS